MTNAPKAFDVWFVTANTVYKAVPYNVVADWTQQGRLASGDMVRPAGTSVAWAKVGEHELLSDYIARPAVGMAVQVETVAAPSGDLANSDTLQESDMLELEPVRRVSRGEEDDDVDMIPLIDVSMVLLVFFILMRAAGALAPVDVPEMQYAGELSNDPQAITITIDKATDPTQSRPEDREWAVYSVRVGQQPAKPEHDNIPARGAEAERREALVRTVASLRELLDFNKPPDVRIACHKDLPRERVYEIRRELETLRTDGKINSFTATVLEAPKK